MDESAPVSANEQSYTHELGTCQHGNPRREHQQPAWKSKRCGSFRSGRGRAQSDESIRLWLCQQARKTHVDALVSIPESSVALDKSASSFILSFAACLFQSELDRRTAVALCTSSGRSRQLVVACHGIREVVVRASSYRRSGDYRLESACVERI